jgi:hypothetical protein
VSPAWRAVSCLLLAVLTLAAPAIAIDDRPPVVQAQPRASSPAGPDFRISPVQDPDFQFYPAAAYNPDRKQFLVVWADTRNAGSPEAGSANIYGRVFNENGSPAGPEKLISDISANAHMWPAVAYNPGTGRFLVAWIDYRVGDSPQVMGRLVNAGGTRIGSADYQINAGGQVEGAQSGVALAYGDDNFLVTWCDLRQFDTRGVDIYGRILSSAGKGSGNDFRISGSEATGHEGNPAVAWNPAAANFEVVWQASPNTTGNFLTALYRIRGRQVKPDRTMTADITISATLEARSGQWMPSLAYNPTRREFLVAWKIHRYLPDAFDRVQARRVNAETGSPIGADILINTSAARGLYLGPSVSFGADRYLVVWQDERDLATRAVDVYARRITGTGGLSTQSLISNASGLVDQAWAKVAYGATHHLIVWKHDTTWWSVIFGQWVAG